MYYHEHFSVVVSLHEASEWATFVFNFYFRERALTIIVLSMLPLPFFCFLAQLILQFLGLC